MGISTSVVIDQIRQLVTAGCDVDTDGVSESDVFQSGCTDLHPSVCETSIASGLLTCSGDLCPLCGHAHSCDESCGFCTVDTGGRRSMQIDLSHSCAASELQGRVDSVNSACCDNNGDDHGGKCQGETGIPTACDARCALAYVPFYNDCKGTLGAQFLGAPQMIQGFQDLANTCANLVRCLYLCVRVTYQ